VRDPDRNQSSDGVACHLHTVDVSGDFRLPTAGETLGGRPALSWAAHRRNIELPDPECTYKLHIKCLAFTPKASPIHWHRPSRPQAVLNVGQWAVSPRSLRQGVIPTVSVHSHSALQRRRPPGRHLATFIRV